MIKIVAINPIGPYLGINTSAKISPIGDTAAYVFINVLVYPCPDSIVCNIVCFLLFQSLIFFTCCITKYMEIATARIVQMGKNTFSVPK